MAYDGNWINELNEATPLGTEAKQLGDNAVREIKRALKNTFPEAVTDEPLEVPFSELNTLSSKFIPRNSIIMWHPEVGSSPDGPNTAEWTVCDGRARANGGNAPNLVDRFILGGKTSTTASPPTNANNAGITGGNAEVNIVEFGTATPVDFDSTEVVLTTNQMPSHRHYVVSSSDANSNSPLVPVSNSNAVSYYRDNPSSTEYVDYRLRSPTDGSGADIGRSSSTGGSEGHSHAFNITAQPGVVTRANMPQYYTLIYLIKE